MTIPALESYCLTRNAAFKPWWISDRNTVIYDFGTHVANVQEATQLLRRQFSGETTLAVCALSPSEAGGRTDWVALEVLMTPERSRQLALRRGLKVNNQAIPVVPPIRSDAAGAYMIMRLSGLPEDESPMTAVLRVRQSFPDLFPSWATEKLYVSNVFPELGGEDEDEYHGSVVVMLEGFYHIPDHHQTAYLKAYGAHFTFEAQTFHYHAYCRQCRELDSHTTENCKFFHPYGVA